MNFNYVYLVNQANYSELVNMNDYDFLRATVIVVPNIKYVDNVFIKLDKDLTNEKTLAVYSEKYNILYYERVFTTEGYAYYNMDDTLEFENE